MINDEFLMVNIYWLFQLLVINIFSYSQRLNI